MAIPYSRPTLPKPLAAGGGRVPTAPKIAKPKAPKVSPYDQFTLPDPYAPKNISSLATSGYNTDTANAQKLAAMGYLTDSAVSADYAQRGATANGIQQALAAHLAGLQGVDVAQGNAGSAALSAQNAATAATAPHIAGAPVAPGLPTGAAQAVLGSQTAAAGNYDSSLQAAALSSGAQANQRALDAGTVAATDNTNAMQKTLASLLSGIPTVSAREGTMTSANSQTDAANKQTLLSIYQQGVSQQEQYAALGEHKQEAAQGLANQRILAQINQSGANSRAVLAADTSTANAQLGAKTKLTTAQIAANKKKTPSPTAAASQKRTQLNQALKIINTTGGTKTTGTKTLTYTVKIQKVLPGGATDPLSPNPTSVTIPAAQAKTYKPPKGYVTLGTPAIAKTSSATTVTNKPGSYTKYNRAASYLKNLGWTQAEIKNALKQYHP